MIPDQLPGVSPNVRRYLLIALALVVGAIAFMVSRCTAPHAPRQDPARQNYAVNDVRTQAIATSSAAVTATQGIRVTIRRSPRAQVATPETSNIANIDRSPAPQGATPQDDWEVTIEATQSVTAAASSGAIASASIGEKSSPVVHESVPDHGRLGLVAGTFPGVAAIDLELARVDLPRGLIGMPLEVGLDLEANHLEAGAGVSVGGKAFIEGLAWSRWDLSDRGLGAGIGLRF